MLEGSQDGLILSDLHGKILSCNKAFARLIGHHAKDLEGKEIASVVDFEGNNQEASDKNGDNGKSDDTTGDEVIVSQTITGMPNRLPANATIFCRNGMDLIMPAAVLPVHDEKKNHSADLTIVYIVQAGSVQQAQTEFVSTVSHELRTPLTSIKGFADTILRAGDRLDLAQQRRYIGIIKDQADRLTRLVEDLLAVSRLESKKMQLTIRAIDLPATVQRVLRNLAEKAGDHRLATTMPPGLSPVWADADRIEQILTNLVDNAIKYSPTGTTVMVSARETNTQPNMVEVSVTDQGVGIPSEHLAEIFSKFSRLDNPLTRSTEGTGLGLYITRSLVIALGGTISVTSTSGNTTFTVQLPSATLEEQAARGRG
jgi:signal transduction histidine kinase